MFLKRKVGKKLGLKLEMRGMTKRHLLQGMVGGLTIILSPSRSSAKPAGGHQQKSFAAKPTYGKTNTGFKGQF